MVNRTRKNQKKSKSEPSVRKEAPKNGEKATAQKMRAVQKAKRGANQRQRSAAKAKSAEKGDRNGAEKLRQDASRALGRSSRKISSKLAKHAEEGDLASVKMLVTLADQQKPPVPRAQEKCKESLTAKWANEPEHNQPEPATALVSAA